MHLELEPGCDVDVLFLEMEASTLFLPKHGGTLPPMKNDLDNTRAVSERGQVPPHYAGVNQATSRWCNGRRFL